jgi:acyl-CoA hydrolase
MKPRPVHQSEAALVRWMSITDANSAGFVHGGTVMKLCDEAAGIAAIKHCRTRIVTAAIDRMTFRHPVHVGELLTCRASVNAVWRTSMEVGVRVEAENPRTGELRHTSTAYLTMVAVDDDGHPTVVPPLLAESPDEERRMREAELRRRNRLTEREQIRAAVRRPHSRSTSAGRACRRPARSSGRSRAVPSRIPRRCASSRASPCSRRAPAPSART